MLVWQSGEVQKQLTDLYLESAHLQGLDRLSRLVLGVCLVHVWLISLGSWVVKNGLRHWVDRKDRLGPK